MKATTKKNGMSAAAWFAASDFSHIPEPKAPALNAINVGQVLMPKADDVKPAEIARTLLVVIEENEALQATLRRLTAERNKAVAEATINRDTVRDQAIVIQGLRRELGALREAFKRDSELIAEGDRS
jgi:hypothetical protein